MPSVVVDSVVVTGGWDPSALERGLAESTRRLEQFVQETANRRVGIRLEVEGADEALRAVQAAAAGLTPEIFTEFAQAATAASSSIERMGQVLQGIDAALQTLAGGGARALQALGQGAASAVAPLANGAQQVATVAREIGALNGARVALDVAPIEQGLTTVVERIRQVRTEAATPLPSPQLNFAPAIGQVERFRQTIGRVLEALPALSLDTDPLAGELGTAVQALERFQRAATDVANLPGLSFADQVQQVAELEAALSGLGPALRRTDPSGILQASALNTRQAVSALLTDLQRLQSQATRTQAALQALASTPAVPPPPPIAPPTGIREVIGQQEQVKASADAAAAAQALMAQSFAASGAQSATLSAAIRETIRFNELLARSAQQAADGLTAQQRAALAAAQANAGAQAAGAGPLAAGALGNVAAANTLAAAESRAAQGARLMAEGIALAARQASILAAAEAAAATNSGRLIAGMTASGIAARETATASATAAAGIGRLGQGAGGIEALGHGARQTALHFVTFAAATAGADTAIARMAASLIGLTTGFGAVTLGALAIFAAAKAWEAFTAGAREAKKRTDEAVDALAKLREAQRDPIRVRLEQTGETTQRLDTLRAKIADLARVQEELKGRSFVFTTSGIIAGSAALVALQNELVKAGREFEKLSGSAAAGGLDIAAEQARQLGEALRLGTAGITGFAEAAESIRRLNAEIGAGAADRSRLNQQQQRSNDLLQSALDPLQRQLDALRALRTAEQRTGVVTLSTADAQRQLDEVQRKLDTLRAAANRSQQPIILKAQIDIEEERLQEQIAPLQIRATLDQQAAQAALQQLQRLRQQAQALEAPVGIRLRVADATAALEAIGQGIDRDLAAFERLTPAAQRAASGTVQQLQALKQSVQDLAVISPLTALVASIAPLAQRLQVLQTLFGGSAEAGRASAGALVQLTQRYGELAAAIAAAGGASQADARLLEAQAAALRALGEGTQPLTAGLAQAVTGLHEAERAARGFAGVVAAGFGVAGLRLNLDTLPAEVALERFLARAKAEASLRATLELDLTEAEAKLRRGEFGSGTAEQQRTVRRILELDVEQARDRLRKFELGGAPAIGETLTLEVGPAESRLRQFRADAAENAAIQSRLELDVRNAAEALRTFQASGGTDQRQRIRIEANLERAQAALAGFLQEVAAQQATVTIDADVSAGSAAVAAFVARLRALQDRKIGLEIEVRNQRVLDEVSNSVSHVGERIQEARKRSDDFFGGMVRRANDPRTAVERLADSIRDITHGLDSIVSAARNVSLIGDEAAQAIGSVLDLADAIGKVIESASTGNIAGLIGAGINLIGGLAGPSEAEIERNRVLDENNVLLQRNNAELAARNAGTGGLASQGASLAALIQQQQLLKFAQVETNPAITIKGAIDEINRQLALAGTNLNEFAAIIKAETGISILDAKGRVVAAAFDQAKQAIEAMIKAATTFGTSFQETQQKLDLGARLSGAADALAKQFSEKFKLTLPESQADQLGQSAAAFQREIDALVATVGNGSSVFKDALKNIDLTDPAAVREALNRIFKRIEAGQLTPEELGGLSKEDWLKFLEDGAGFLDQLGQSSKDAANGLAGLSKTLTNVPETFKLAAAEFAVRRVDVVPPAPSPAVVAAAQAPVPTAEPVQLPGTERLAEALDSLGAGSTLGDLAKLLSEGNQDQATGLRSLLEVLANRATPGAAAPNRSLPSFLAGPGATPAGRQGDGVTILQTAPSTSTTTITSTITGPITITIQGSAKDSGTLAREIRRELEQASLATFGNPDQWGGGERPS